MTTQIPAEKRAYARGYEAGRKRKAKDIRAEVAERERRQFADRAFLALLPAAMQVQGWTIGDEKVTTTERRVELAVRWTRRAVQARSRIY